MHGLILKGKKTGDDENERRRTAHEVPDWGEVRTLVLQECIPCKASSVRRPICILSATDPIHHWTITMPREKKRTGERRHIYLEREE